VTPLAHAGGSGTRPTKFLKGWVAGRVVTTRPKGLVGRVFGRVLACLVSFWYIVRYYGGIMNTYTHRLLPFFAGLLLYTACLFWAVSHRGGGRVRNCADGVRAAVAMVAAEDAVFDAVSQCGPQCNDLATVQGLVQDAKRARMAFTYAATQCLE
jgi:hypothetical protein